ncbi:PREDICTED: uncharacterized protein LOC105122928 [Populus euphratica]|uniref:Uncharacterized protein LOC105122928 n=1 Tax=Populus euphratica TaxID=75702 RepID=A0AAJ6U0W1_POPEU|nr:PREDICTED: uncharacterized protein LOC105122928 [Populus euphratica]
MNSGKGASSSKTETEDEGINGTGIAAATGAVAGAALVAWGIGSAPFSSSKPDSGKTMKAPGRDYRIPRADFERDPKGYFKNRSKYKAGMLRG